MSEGGSPAALRLVVSGRVQGVAFRAFTRRRALELGLVGWVKNLPDGGVEVRAEGPSPALESLRQQLRQGPPAARVDGVSEWPLEATGEWTTFRIVF